MTNTPQGPINISDRYRVTSELGSGGMAAVYAAVDTRYDREVAVKVLNPDLAAGLAAERFLREISIVAKLTHPHIVPLLDSGETDGRLWFVMPLLPGKSLRDKLTREKQLPIGESVRICYEVAMALAYAHSHGVAHRDVKPENVLISGGSAAVADFGLVKVIAEATRGQSLTQTGTAVGTTYYMSPEQATGEQNIDGRTDIYSLGCMLYEMLTGEPPFTGATTQAVMAKHVTDAIPRAGRLRQTVPPAVDDVITRALAKVPADRYPDAAQMAEALQRAISSGSHASVGVAALSAPSLASTPPVPTATSADTGVTRAVRRPRVIAAIGAALLVTAVGAYLWQRAAVASGVPRSVAVLPFANLSPGQDQEYFSTGMTDELLGALSSIEGLRVAARTSSYAFRNREADFREIGARLNVEALLEGSVRRDGDHVRVLAELVSVADGSSLWRGTFDRTISDVFKLQEDVAQAIVAALRITLAAPRALVHRSTEDVEAYQLYLRGRYAWNQRTPTSLRQADDYFRQAVQRDPNYARAWAGIADVHIVQGLNVFEPPGASFERGKAAALKAIALDSTLSEAHASLGTIHFLFDREWAAAEAEYQRALTLDSTYSNGHYFYTLFLSARRRPEAMAVAQRAMRLDPLAPPIAQTSGIVLIQDGMYAQAIAPLRAAIALQPQYYFPHSWLAIALAMTGARDEAIAEASRAIELAQSNSLVKGVAAFVRALAGDRAGALGIIRDLENLSRTQPVPWHYIGRAYDALGDGPKALESFRRALIAREGQLSQMLVEPRVRTIGSHPEFLAILKELNLP